MQDNPLGRKMVYLTLPIEALLDVIAGRTTLKLPPEIPEDSKFCFYYVDQEKQILQIAVTHDSFEQKLFDAHITECRVLMGENEPKEGSTKGIDPESLPAPNEVDRLV